MYLSNHKAVMSLTWPHATGRWYCSLRHWDRGFKFRLRHGCFVCCAVLWTQRGFALDWSPCLGWFAFIHSQALIVQDGPLASLFGGFLITHIQTHGRTPLDEWSARRRGLYLHRTTQQTNIHASSGIWTRDPSNQAAADLRLRPLCHWDRLMIRFTSHKWWWLLTYNSCR
jgi:hypothetical protein